MRNVKRRSRVTAAVAGVRLFPEQEKERCPRIRETGAVHPAIGMTSAITDAGATTGATNSAAIAAAVTAKSAAQAMAAVQAMVAAAKITTTARIATIRVRCAPATTAAMKKRKAGII